MRTDGLSEARNAAGAFYPVIARLRTAPTSRPRDLITHLMTGLAQWTHDSADDIALIALTTSPRSPNADEPPQPEHAEPQPDRAQPETRLLTAAPHFRRTVPEARHPAQVDIVAATHMERTLGASAVDFVDSGQVDAAAAGIRAAVGHGAPWSVLRQHGCLRLRVAPAGPILRPRRSPWRT
ncbi:SpoIIE family protein phosphatase [Streptomyces sp. CB02009]|uniref:SpoIIE family protein phosphatase n=1 Tax=Streptomyces sp. CB02009 TaxID=1703938 RepID=UPI00403EE2CA